MSGQPLSAPLSATAKPSRPGVNLPPGPRLPALAQSALFARDPLGFQRRSLVRHGDPFTLKVFPFGDLVYVANPEDVKRIFTGDPAVFRAGEANSFMEPMLGPNSVLLLDQDAHMRQRKLMLPPFHGEAVRRYGELMAGIAAREVATWPLGRPFALRPAMQRVTLEVILRAVFGIDEADRLDRLTGRLIRFVEVASSPLAMLPAVRRDLGRWSPWARFKRLRADVDEMLYEQIALRRAAANGHGDVLSLLVAARHEDGRPMSDHELRDELMTLLGAGHETTATALAWAFERLARHPEALARLREELASGGETYLDAVVRETLRVRPVVLDVARHLAAPAEVAGYHLPAGVHVVPAIALVQLRPDLYPEPEAFRPERFLDGQPDPYAWIPFGGGVRRCLGAAFAQLEMKVVLREVLTRVTPLATDAPGERLKLRNVTLVPGRGAEVTLARA